MTDSYVELLAALEGMPAFLDSAAARLQGEVTRRDGGAFSLLEHAWHLADLEREGYGARLERLLTENDPFLEDFEGDRLARERSYQTRRLRDGLDAFANARRQNLALLRGLPPEALAREGQQAGVGRLTLGDVPRMMRAHDASHRKEIEALLSESDRKAR
jgi:hypothetical protein